MLSDAAPFEVKCVRLDLRGTGNDRRVIAHYDLEIDRSDPSRRLVFDYLNKRLGIAGFSIDGASVRDLGQETGHALFVVEPVDAWQSAIVRLTIEFHWAESDDDGVLPVVSFPEQLPKPASTIAIEGDYLRAPLYVDGNAPSTVDVVGVQLNDGPWDPHREAQLQISFIPNRLVVFRSDELIIARHDGVKLPESRYRAIAAELARIRAYLANELDFHPSMRVAIVVLRDPHEIDRLPGAVLAIRPVDLEQDGGIEQAILLKGAEDLASTWWGAGVQMPGRYGAVAALGIRYALSLRQLASAGHAAELDAMTKRLRGYAEAQMPVTASARQLDSALMAQVTLQLSRALAEQPAARQALRDTTRSLWGTKPSPDEVLSRLRVAGVELPERAARLNNIDEYAEAIVEQQYAKYAAWGKLDPARTVTRLRISPEFERRIWGLVYAMVGLAAMGGVWAITGALPANATRAIGPIAFVAVGMSWWNFWRAFNRRIVRDLGWGTRTVVMNARARLNPVLCRILHWRLKPIAISGLQVYVVGDTEGERVERARRFGLAIDEIRAMWPSRYERLQRIAPSIDIMPFGAAGGYLCGANVIVLQAQLVDGAPPDALASVLIHELSHAYSEACGIGLSPWAETRIERIAHTEMLYWARRLHSGGRPEAASATYGIYLNSMRRWWWRADGTRVHGSEFDAA